MRDKTIGSAEFKANCLAIIESLQKHVIDRVTITRRGQPVAVMTAPPTKIELAESLHGCMRGSVHIPDDFDLTAPILDEAFDAERGALHR